jgi:hypothetical protein
VTDEESTAGQRIINGLTELVGELKESPPRRFLTGTRVQVAQQPELIGRITEFRGPLGPNGENIYRVRIRFGGGHIEVREDQLTEYTAPPPPPAEADEPHPDLLRVLADLRHVYTVGSLDRHDKGIIACCVRTLERLTTPGA